MASRMKYQDLDTKGKLDYIWDYYKIPIISGLVLIIFVFSLLNTLVFNRPKDVGLDITIRGKNADIANLDSLGDTSNKDVASMLATLENLAGINTDEFRLMLDFLSIDDNIDPNIKMAYEAKFMAKFPADEIDVLIVHDEYLSRLKEEIPVDRLEGFDELSADLFVNDKAGDLIGIRLAAFDTLSELMAANADEYSVFVFKNSLRKEAAKELLKNDVKKKY